MFGNVYKDRKVLVTGNTGFKGTWLVLWLLKLGAKVVGYSLNIPSQPSLHEILDLDFETIVADVRDIQKLRQAIASFQPDIVFHSAAQSLVRRSYQYPVETFETNVMGTVNVFEACRQVGTVKVIVNITSDKCYENREWVWGYRENDPMGGHDPYSASKGCAELVTASYRRSFFPAEGYHKTHQTLLASVRAGNIIGGGDWGEDRLVSDIMLAASQRKKVLIRNPDSIRPWQYVLEPLSGYLFLGQKLLEGKKGFAEAWNFGPGDEGHKDVLSVVRELQTHWPCIDVQIASDEKNPHEATLLKLDCSKSHAKLEWKPIWNASAMFAKTAQWYREFYESDRVLSQAHLDEYVNDAREKNMPWAVS